MLDAAESSESRFTLTGFRSALRGPETVQARVLRRILARNADCEIGRRFGFADIEGEEDFRRRVPVLAYDDLRPSIERMAHGEAGVLTSEPVLAWEETGGSSGGAKLVPYTASGLDAFRAGLLPWLESLERAVPAAFAGRAYWSISPVARPSRSLPGGQHVGMSSDAMYFGESVAQRLVSSLAVPPQVGSIDRIETWRRLTLMHLAACEDLAFVSIWSPTFLLQLLSHLSTEARDIGDDLRHGRIVSGLSAPRASSARIELLVDVARTPRPQWQRLWPNLALISCWNHASAEGYARELQSCFPEAVVQGKGLLATEGLVTVPIDVGHDPVLSLESGFFEFVDSGGRARMAHEVEVDADYELLMTTSSGLYRYAIGDRVRVTGRIEATPTLRFIGRAGVHSDLCGEKLDEAFVADALRCTGAMGAMLVVRRLVPGYVLVLDADATSEDGARAAAEKVESALCANPQYAYARTLGQLAAVTCERVRDPVGAWLSRGTKLGQRLGDIKIPTLCPGPDGAAVFGIET